MPLSPFLMRKLLGVDRYERKTPPSRWKNFWPPSSILAPAPPNLRHSTDALLHVNSSVGKTECNRDGGMKQSWAGMGSTDVERTP